MRSAASEDRSQSISHMTANVEEHYTGTRGRTYFNSRISVLDLQVKRYQASLFQRHIASNATVVDFGCGSGGILRNIDCTARIGVEINELSTIAASAAGIKAHRSLGEIADESADVAISHHALEHTAHPLHIVSELHRILKPRGKLIVVVPCEPGRSPAFKRWREQVDMHLYSWNPLSLGNLVTVSGFTVVESFVRTNGYSRLNRWLLPMPPVFAVAERLFGHILGRFITVCVAVKR